MYLQSTGSPGGAALGTINNYPLFFFTNSSSAQMVLANATGNLLIGTTTDITGTGGLHVAGTGTASTTTSGALRVGSNVGLSGNAGGASYFGGQVSSAGGGTAGTLPFTSANATLGGYEVFSASASLDQKRWQWQAGTAVGDGTIRLRAINDATTNGSNAISITRTAEVVGTITLGAAGSVTNIPGTTPASSSTAGALTIGNGTPATNVAIGGGNVNAGGIISATAGGFKGANYLNSTGLTGNIITGDTNQDFYVNGSIKMSLSAATTSLSSTTPSTLTTNGALVVAGGVGVSGAVVAGGFTFGTTPNASYPFYAAGSAAGTPVSMRISHSDGTNATSNARIILDTASGGGDPFINFISGAVEWSLGVDNSASDVFKLSRSGAIGTTDALTIDGSNAATFAGAVSANGLLTVTGSGTETSVATAKVGASALGGIPRVNLINPTNTANGKYGDLINTSASGNGALQFRFIDDALASATPVFSVTGRQGATDSFVTAPGTGAHTFGTTNTVTMTAGALATTGAATFAGAVSLSTAGTTVSIKSGTNAAAGTVTLVGGNGTITSTAIDVNTVIVMTIKTKSGTFDHAPSVVVAAGSATIDGHDSDASTYNWVALKVN
jgi:hypothetical protein